MGSSCVPDAVDTPVAPTTMICRTAPVLIHPTSLFCSNGSHPSTLPPLLRCRCGRQPTRRAGRTARADDPPPQLSSLVSRFSRSTRERDLLLELGPEGGSAPPEALNEKAVKVIRRVQDKLAGLDFGNDEPYKVDKQVDLLIKQVSSLRTQFYVLPCLLWR